MKKSIPTLFLIILFLKTNAQWTNHAYLSLPNIPNWSVYFNDAVFTSNDTGYYCISAYGPSPSQPDDAGLYQTINDCSSWNTIFWDSNVGVSSYAVKYFHPHLYYLRNWQGFFIIQRTLDGVSWNYFSQTSGYYKDFFANDSLNYKILYLDYSNRTILRTFENNIQVHLDTFPTNKPTKINYPIDTLGILLSTSFPSTGVNTTILRYVPTTGYSIVYQNQNRKLSDLSFPSMFNGYVSCDSGLILHSNDLGYSWNSLITGFNKKLNSIYFINDSCGYSVGDSGLIISTINFGATWTQQSCPINSNLNRIQFVNDSVGYILSGQEVLKTINSGMTWVKENLSTSNHISTFPNPTSGKLSITIPTEFLQEKKLYLQIFDSAGKLIEQKTANISDGKIDLDLETEAKGIYNISLSNGYKNCSGTIILE